MSLDSVQGGLLQTPIAVGFQVESSECGKGQAVSRGSIVRRLAIEFNERHNVHSCRQLQKVLFQPHEQVVNLACLGFGLGIGDLPDGERIALPMVKELAIPTTALLLE